jgi:hypothetical protein
MNPSTETEATNALNTFLTKIETNILDPIIILVALAAFVVFAFGVVEFILGAGEEEKRSKGKKHMFWGVIGLTIMFGAQTILFILKRLVGAT